jgi:repressor LexA
MPAMPRPNHDNTYLTALQDYYAQHRLIPSLSVISELLGFSAKNAAAALVGRLEEAGYLTRTSADRRLTPTPRFFERPRSIATVRAGMPEAAMDESAGSADMVNVDMLLVRQPSITFLVPIKGDSMRDVGLMDGDTAVCERRQWANPGEIVVALTSDGMTVKTLLKEGSRYVLKPENKDYPILRPDPLDIIGVVTGSFRSYAHANSHSNSRSQRR